MNNATAVFNTLPTGILKRKQAGEIAISAFANYSLDYDVKWMAQGIEWADRSCRIDGVLAIALRKMTAWQIAGLILHMLKAGITMNDVPRWLMQNRELILG